MECRRLCLLLEALLAVAPLVADFGTLRSPAHSIVAHLMAEAALSSDEVGGNVKPMPLSSKLQKTDPDCSGISTARTCSDCTGTKFPERIRALMGFFWVWQREPAAVGTERLRKLSIAVLHYLATQVPRSADVIQQQSRPKGSSETPAAADEGATQSPAEKHVLVHSVAAALTALCCDATQQVPLSDCTHKCMTSCTFYISSTTVKLAWTVL